MLLDIFTPTDNAIICLRGDVDGKRRDAHWFPWLLLVWTFWIFATPILEAGGEFPQWMWPTLTSFVVFLWLFYRVYYRDRSQVIWCALGIAALGFVVTPFNPGAQGYLIYACAFLAFSGRPRESVRNMAIVLALYTVEWRLLGFDWGYLLSAILIGFAIGFMNINFMLKHQRDAELKLSHEEVRRLAALAERERIGRDLHDLLGHTLSLITLKAELASKLFDRDALAARREIADVERVARDALAQVRRAVTGIRAAGIAAELASAKLLLESNGVAFSYGVADVSLPVEIETALAMTVREAVTNVQRHARATRVRIDLAVADGRLELRIEDDGRGGAIVPGNGLTGMRERLTSIDGHLLIDSVRGRGTRLTASFALPASGTAHAAPKMREA
ncbi:MAG TPA: sensor histidine kinase [Rudaea sp.]|nr:sensor histidine kinase [Rudaea sp.]